MLAYLWQRNQHELLDEMINANVQAILIKTAALGKIIIHSNGYSMYLLSSFSISGLYPKKHLGKTIAEMRPILEELVSY